MQDAKPEYLHAASAEELRQIRTHSGKTSSGKRFDWFIREKFESSEWRLECIRSDVLGLSRPLEVYRARRKTNLIKP